MRSYLWCFWYLFALQANPVNAKEVINYFHSHIIIEKSGEITVTETIEVNAENKLINRGIYRDFPTQYLGAWLTKQEVGFKVLGVSRNNQPEPFHTENLSNGIRVYIGSSSTVLEPGLHRYQLTYETNQQLGYFEDYDEFYWNVTGNGWEFDILKATATIELPEQGRQQVQDQQAWTGYQGEQNQDFIITNTDVFLGFETTKTLKKNQGLTIGLQVPKGIFDQPSFDLAVFLASNIIWILGLLVMLLYFGFFLTAWYRFGRDPETGVIMARFKPPEGLSAAAVHYIDNEVVNDKTMTAALLSLAVKGQINITQQKKQYLIKKLTPNKSKKNKSTQNMTKLSKGERVIMRSLFPGNKKQTTLSKTPNSYLTKAKDKLTSLLHREYKKKCFADNKSYMIWGWVISSVCLFVVTLLIYNQILNPAKLLILIVLCLFFLFVATAIFSIFPIIASLIFLLGLGIISYFLVQKTLLFFTIFLFGMNLLFTYLMRSPTVFGRHIKDQIDGLKLYMKSAEENRLNILNPPDQNIEHYERLLPYAVALNLENQWAEKFSSMINTETTATSGSNDGLKQTAYQPSWYTNQYNNDNKINFSVASISRSLKRSVAASTKTPTPVMSSSTGSSSSSYASSSSKSSSSSSYSSGSSGGSSGGGGGGGGGGGW